MKVIKILATGTCLMLIMANCVFGRGWRGIVPLHSSRKEVERLLGPSTKPRPAYKLEDIVVVVDYADGPCEKCWPFGWNVPTGTVLSVTVRPTRKLNLVDSGFDLSSFKKTKDPEVEAVSYYTNEEEGVTIVYRDLDQSIDTIIYGPSAQEKNLSCPADLRNPHGRSGVGPYPKQFDHYGDISFVEERKLLDYFVARLRGESSHSKGYVVVYAGHRARVCEAELRATRAKNYLMNQQGIKSENIVVINGGYREQLTVELYIGQATELEPVIMPTIRPSRVQIIPDDRETARLRRSLKIRRPQCACQ
jgi:hypothetical protein